MDSTGYGPKNPAETHEGPPGLALALLQKAALGEAVGALLPRLVASVLRTEVPGSERWAKALDVLEAGELAVRAAVELAGVVLRAEQGRERGTG